MKAKLHLAERTYECDSCGLVIDRDLDAAVNPRATRKTRSQVLGSSRAEPTVRPIPR